MSAVRDWPFSVTSGFGVRACPVYSRDEGLTFTSAPKMDMGVMVKLPVTSPL